MNSDLIVQAQVEESRTYDVNSTLDIDDNNIGDGICDARTPTQVSAGVPAFCTLRAAISETNFTDIVDTINLPASADPYAITLLTEGGEGDFNINGDFDINADLNIIGDDPSTTVIDANDNADVVIEIGAGLSAGTNITVTIENVRISGATSNSGPTSTEAGDGGIYVKRSGLHTLNLNNVIVSDNEGAGVVNDTLSVVNISNSVVRNNRKSGLRNFGVMNVTNSTIRDNTGSAGILNGSVSDSTGTMTIINSIISDNFNTGDGGGLELSTGTQTTIEDSYIIRNTGRNGGGILIGRSVLVRNSVIAANTATSSGGGFYVVNSNNPDNNAEFINSTISDNQSIAVRGGPIDQGGGGFYNRGRTILRNVTLTGNTATEAGGGFFHLDRRNGDNSIQPGITKLNNVTIANNEAEFGGGYYDGSSLGRPIEVSNSIISNNSAVRNGPDCFDSFNNTNSLGNNLIGDADDCSLPWSTDTNDLIEAPTSITALADNGGPTCTIALQETSVVRGAGEPTSCESTDQRGGTRGTTCDMGAFEFDATGIPPRADATPLVCVFDNIGPEANDDSYTTPFATELNVSAAEGVLANDVDEDGDPLTAILEVGPATGTVVLNADGSFLYSPPASAAGEIIFTYRVSDGVETSNVAAVRITITGALPTANNDIYSTSPGERLIVEAPGVLANDTDPQDDPLTAIIKSEPSEGTIVEFNLDGSFTYDPPPDGIDGPFTGTLTFTYVADDTTSGESDLGTVTINITEDPPPVAINDSYNTTINTPLTIDAPGVLTNDTTEVADVTLSVNPVVTDVTNGALTLNTDGSFTYIPDTDFVGTDSFVYTITDGTSTSNEATVSVTVSEAVPTLFTENDTYTTTENTALTVEAPGVISNDTVPDGVTVTAAVGTEPLNGALSLNGDGSFTYTPNTDFVGNDTFTYTITDGTETSSPAIVTITVGADGGGSDLIAEDDTYNTPENTTLNIAAPGVLDNDIIPDGVSVTLSVGTSPGDGSVTLNDDGSFEYTPNTDFVGNDTFTYTITDGTETSSPAIVTITVGADGGGSDLIANPDNYTTPADTRLNVSAPGVKANDLPAGTTASPMLVTPPSGDNLVVLNSNGSFSFVPEDGFEGEVTFTYQLVDGGDSSEPTTVTITVGESTTPTAPVANNDSYTTPVNLPLTPAAPGVLANDEFSGTSISLAVVTDVTNGTLDFSAGNGSFTYTPATGFTGVDFFVYTITADGVASNQATVSIQVGSTSGVLVTEPDNYTTEADTPLSVPAPGVLTNDTVTTGTTLRLSVTTIPENGVVDLDDDGAFTYTPDAGFTGTDFFNYNIFDGTNIAAPTTVTITIGDGGGVVIGPGVPPRAITDRYATLAGTALTIPANRGVLNNDIDPDTASSELTALTPTAPSGGSLTLNPNGSFTYTPDAGFTGTDTFTYVASDGDSSSAPATVSVDVYADPGTTGTVVGPSGTVSNGINPLIIWTPNGAASYTVWIAYSGTASTFFFIDGLSAAEYCAGGLCTLDVSTELEGFWQDSFITGFGGWYFNAGYDVWLCTTNCLNSADGYSLAGSFTLTAPAPTAATPGTTNNISGSIPQPEITWTLTGNAIYASWFLIYVDTGGTGVVNTWVSRNEACGSTESNECAYSVDVANGSYTYYIISWGPSNPALDIFAQGNFSVSAAAPTLPTTATVTNPTSASPTVTWTHSEGTTWYNIVFYVESVNFVQYNQWFTATELGCTTGTCTFDSTVDPTYTLPNGATYDLYLQLWGPGVTGDLPFTPTAIVTIAK